MRNDTARFTHVHSSFTGRTHGGRALQHKKGGLVTDWSLNACKDCLSTSNSGRQACDSCSNYRHTSLLISVIKVPEERTGSSQVLPAHTPAFIGSVASRMRTVATISLSATGSRNAPNGVEVPCTSLIFARVGEGVLAQHQGSEMPYHASSKVAIQVVCQASCYKDPAADCWSKGPVTEPNCKS